jgi:hypothetical protein
MKRRDFWGSVGVAAAGSLMLSDSADARPIPQRIEFANGPTDRPLDTRLVVKPVFAPLIHSDVWEGPCRPGGESPTNERDFESLLKNDPSAIWAMAGSRTPEQEKADAEANLKRLVDTLKKDLGRDILVLDPMFMTYSEDFWIRPEYLAKLEAEKDQVDAYLVSGGFMNYPGTIIAETLRTCIEMAQVLVFQRWMHTKG